MILTTNMYNWLKNINLKKLLVASLVYTLIAMIIHEIEALLTLQYYMKPQYFGLWSRLLMPTAGPPPLEFFVTSFLFSFTTGIALAFVYFLIKDQLSTKFRERSLLFADILICMYFVFFTLPTYLMFNAPFGLLVIWFISAFVILTLSAMAYVKIFR